MDTPQSLDATPAPAAPGSVSGSRAQLEGVSLAALLAVFIGWFFVNTLVVSLGSLQHGVRFFDISSAIADPLRIFFGVDATWQRFVFGLICVGCLLAPIYARQRGYRWAWLTHLGPLTLIVVCGALLYSKTSGEFFATPSDANTLSGSVIRFANHLVKGSGLASRHISIGVGGYLAFAGSVVLAATGIRRYRAP
jgi:hypothetical protein